MTAKNKRGTPDRGLKVVCAFTNWGGGGLVEFDAEFKFAKIQNCHVEGGGRVGGGLTEFDAQFKFAKIQNSYVEGGVSWNLMLSSNLLKSKIPMSSTVCVGGGGVSGTNFQLLMLSSNLLKSKIPMSSTVWECGGGLVEPTFNF